jgi:hypothetical protein
MTDQHLRARILVAAGISPDRALSARAQTAVATLLACRDHEVEALLALLVLVGEARRPRDHADGAQLACRLEYPNPRPGVTRRPAPPD